MRTSESIFSVLDVDGDWSVTEYRPGFEGPQVIARCPNIKIAESIRDSMEAAELLRVSSFKLESAVKLANKDQWRSR